MLMTLLPRRRRAGDGRNAAAHDAAEADGQRRQDAYSTTATGTVCLSRLRLRSVLLCKDGPSIFMRAAVEEECPAHDRKDPRGDRAKGSVARRRDDGEAAQSHVDRMGELLQPRSGPQSVPSDRSLHPASAPPVAMQQAQGCQYGSTPLLA